MSIKAKFRGRCSLCDEWYEIGDHIGWWLGLHTHFTCRQTEIRRRADAGEAEQLEEARGWADRPAMTAGKKGRRRYASLGALKWQDGRSQDGRYQSKPEPR